MCSVFNKFPASLSNWQHPTEEKAQSWAEGIYSILIPQSRMGTLLLTVTTLHEQTPEGGQEHYRHALLDSSACQGACQAAVGLVVEAPVETLMSFFLSFIICLWRLGDGLTSLTCVSILLQGRKIHCDCWVYSYHCSCLCQRQHWGDLLEG